MGRCICRYTCTVHRFTSLRVNNVHTLFSFGNDLVKKVTIQKLLFVFSSRDAPAYYSWSVPEGFSIEPVKGLLSPKETGKFKAFFSPLAAKVYKRHACSSFSDKSSSHKGELKVGGYNFKRSMKLEGIGKSVHLTAEPHLTSSDCSTDIINESNGVTKTFEKFTLDFGVVAIGRKWEINVIITSTSEVCVFDCTCCICC